MGSSTMRSSTVRSSAMRTFWQTTNLRGSSFTVAAIIVCDGEAVVGSSCPFPGQELCIVTERIRWRKRGYFKGLLRVPFTIGWGAAPDMDVPLLMHWDPREALWPNGEGLYLTVGLRTSGDPLRAARICGWSSGPPCPTTGNYLSELSEAKFWK